MHPDHVHAIQNQGSTTGARSTLTGSNLFSVMESATACIAGTVPRALNVPMELRRGLYRTDTHHYRNELN